MNSFSLHHTKNVEQDIYATLVLKWRSLLFLLLNLEDFVSLDFIALRAQAQTSLAQLVIMSHEAGAYNAKYVREDFIALSIALTALLYQSYALSVPIALRE